MTTAPHERPRWLYLSWYFGRFVPHSLIAVAGVWTVFFPPLSLTTALTAVARVLWCILLVFGAAMCVWGLGHFDERPRVVGLFAEGFGMLSYALALAGRGVNGEVTALVVGALSAFLFKSCIYAALRLRAEKEKAGDGWRSLRAPDADSHHGGGAWYGVADEPGVEGKEATRGRDEVPSDDAGS